MNCDSLGDDGSIFDKLEKNFIVDLATAGILGLGAMKINGMLGYSESILGISTNPAVIAVQISGFLALVYLLEFKEDHQNDNAGSFQANSSLGNKLDNMAGLDLLTIAALGLNSYVLYSEALSVSISELTEFGGGTQVVMLQASAGLGLVYLMEYFSDKDDDNRRGLGR